MYTCKHPSAGQRRSEAPLEPLYPPKRRDAREAPQSLEVTFPKYLLACDVSVASSLPFPGALQLQDPRTPELIFKPWEA